MGIQILLVDSDLDSLSLLGVVLVENGFNVIPCSNGRQALVHAISKNPDLIILSEILPDMSGITVSEVIRYNKNLSKVPIIFVSSHPEYLHAGRFIRSGGTAVIGKPVDPSDLLVLIHRQLELVKKTDSTSSQNERQFYV